jgi:hypothetical protein
MRSAVTIVKCCQFIKEYDVLILYQPNIALSAFFENTAVRLPTFITGTTTDFPLLNQQKYFSV